MRSLTVVLLGLLAAACGDAGGPSTQLVPAALQVVGGADQIAVVAKELPQVVAVKVFDANAGPIPNYPVSWTALDGGSVFTGYVLTGTDGIARQRWTLGPAAWPGGDPGNGRMRQRLVARLLDPETGAVLLDDTVTAVARPDVAVALTLHNNFAWLGDSTGAGIMFRDRFNNMLAPCPATGTWEQLTWWSADSSIAFPTGQLFWSGPSADGDRVLYGYVRGVRLGSTTIGVTAACIPSSVSFTFEVLVKP